jgi:hypothetical protein
MQWNNKINLLMDEVGLSLEAVELKAKFDTIAM